MSVFRSPAGFSIIELMFAMVFLTVIVLGTTRLLTSQLKLSATSAQELRAQELAADKAEMLMADGKATACAQNTTEPAVEVVYTRTVAVDSTGLEGGACRATVTVSWDDGTGAHQVTAKRVIYE